MRTPSPSRDAALELAYAQCRRLTRAAGSSFSAGIRILPSDRRDALYAIYALARRIDDVADGELTAEQKLAELAEIRAALHRPPSADDPVLVALDHAAGRLPIPLEAFDDLLDGAAQDAHPEPIATFGDLERYARRVAGSIGRLALGVFDCSDRERAQPLADDLGVALQIANILRDVREDASLGRLYLPAEDLERFGCHASAEGLEGPAEPLLAFEARRGVEWLDRGLELIPLIDRRSASCVRAMTGAYRVLLARIERDPGAVLRGRLTLAPWEKGLVIARSLTAVGSR